MFSALSSLLPEIRCRFGVSGAPGVPPPALPSALAAAAVVASALVSAPARADSSLGNYSDPVISARLAHPDAEVSVKAKAGSPVFAFCTDNGVYELDSADKLKAVRVWNWRAANAELASSKLDGADKSARVAAFAAPVAMALHPTQPRIAVVDRSQSASTVRVYSFEEVLDPVSGQLSSVTWTREAVATNADWAAATAVAWTPDGASVVVSYQTRGQDLTAAGRPYFRAPKLDVLPVDLSSVKNTIELPFRRREGTGDNSADVVSAIAFDSVNGAFYAAVAASNAVYRFASLDAASGAPEASYGRMGAFVGAGASGDALDPHSSTSFSGSVVGRLASPSGIAIWHPEGADAPVVLVTDKSNARVLAFGDALFEPRVLVAEKNAVETVWNSFQNPQGVWAADGGTSFVVADSGYGRVRVFDVDVSSLMADESVVMSFDSGETSIPESGFFDDSNAVTGSVRALSMAFAPGTTNRTYTLSLSHLGEDGEPDGADAAQYALLFSGDGLEDGAAANAADGATSLSLSLPFGETLLSAYVLALDGTSSNVLEIAGASGDAGLAFEVENVAPMIVDAAAVTASGDGDTVAGASVSFSAEYLDVAADLPLEYAWATSDGQSADSETVQFSFAGVGDVTNSLTLVGGDGGEGRKVFLLRVTP